MNPLILLTSCKSLACIKNTLNGLPPLPSPPLTHASPCRPPFHLPRSFSISPPSQLSCSHWLARPPSTHKPIPLKPRAVGATTPLLM